MQNTHVRRSPEKGPDGDAIGSRCDSTARGRRQTGTRGRSDYVRGQRQSAACDGRQIKCVRRQGAASESQLLGRYAGNAGSTSPETSAPETGASSDTAQDYENLETDTELRKMQNNMRERKRVSMVKEQFEKLRQCLPKMPSRIKTRVQTLRPTREYILLLQKQLGSSPRLQQMQEEPSGLNELGQSPAVGQPPVHKQPRESELAPMNGELPPMSGELPPMSGERPPMYGEQPPMYGEHRAMCGEHPPMYGEQPPMYSEQSPMYGEQPPMYGEHRPMYGEHPPMYGEHPPMYGEHPPMYGEHPPMYGEQPPMYGEQRPMYGPIYGDHPPMYGEQPRMYGAQPLVCSGAILISRMKGLKQST